MMPRSFLFTIFLAGFFLADGMVALQSGLLERGSTLPTEAIVAPSARAAAPSLAFASAEPSHGITVEEAERQLTLLKRLCDQGLIASEECQRRQQSILEQTLSSAPPTLPRTPLSVVPADAVGFVGVPNLKRLDERIAAIIRDLRLVEVLPAGAMLTAGREFIAGRKGFDENAPLFLSLLEVPTAVQWATRSGLIVPTADPEALLASFNPEPPIDGVSPITVFDTKVFATTKRGALVIASEPNVVTAIALEDTGIDTRLTAQDAKAISNLDLIVWINAARAFNTVWSELDAWSGIFRTLGGAQPGTLQAILSQHTLTSINMLREGLATLSGGVSLGKMGVGLRVAVSMEPSSGLARLWGAPESRSGPILLGLPNEDFVFASGQMITSEQAMDTARWLSFLFEAREVKDRLGAEPSEQFKNSLTSWYSMLRGVALAVYSPEPGPDGLLNLQTVWEVTDAKQWIGHLRDLIIHIKALKSDDPKSKAALQAITYKLGAVFLEGVAIDEVHLDLSALETPEIMEQMLKVIGQDGLTLRLAVVDPTHVAVSVGGSGDLMARLIANVKLGKAPLSDDLRIRAVADYLPGNRFAEGYVVLDRVAVMVSNISHAVGEQVQLPSSIFQAKAPLAVVTSGDTTSMHVDLYMPLEVLAALRSASAWQPGKD